MRRRWSALIGAGAVLATPGAARAAVVELPPASRCVEQRMFTFRLQAGTAATVRVDGKLFKRVAAGPSRRAVRLRFVPRGRHTLTIAPRSRAAVERTYQTCIDTRPVIEVPPGEKPTTLALSDLTTGSLRKARKGQIVGVRYSLVRWSDGKEVDSSWDRDAVFEFPLGRGQVIAGFDQGVEGMKIGGRRAVIVPPDLGYGPEGADDLIGPDETLIFVVDLVSVRDIDRT
jgi:peptidylprolyl isomerase